MQGKADALTARPSSKNASRICVTKVSHTAGNEDKHMIFDTRKSFMIAPIDCNATTFDSSQDEDQVSGADVLSLSETVAVAASGDDGVVSTFLHTCGKSLSSSGNVTFHMHSSHVSRLSVAPYNWSVLNSV